ncbi:hypothetical protein [Paracidovorax anthurii]|uniref:Uncharacterized protein n=1 Tax=Paracidovorax anthurii TaxID=78229 RepID=A0A328ZUY1_9BURK|nr:hypothetical protein [Paracidovorax anthurii]RAR86076.1 hypothetical protein AX018_100237 [Paracidovorax anthurii]
MAAKRKPRGHERLFSLSNGTSVSLECAHALLGGRFTKFLWANLYDQAGREVASACKLLPGETRWHSCRAIDASGPMQELLRDLMPHRGQWVRIQFAYRVGGA